MRFNELIAGVRSDVAVKVFGDDSGEMNATAAKIAAVLRRTPGATDVEGRADRGPADARHRLPPRRAGTARRHARRTWRIPSPPRSAAARRGGSSRATGSFPVVIRLDDATRADLDRARPDAGADAGRRPSCRCRRVADIAVTDGPNQISRENGKRRVVRAGQCPRTRRGERGGRRADGDRAARCGFPPASIWHGAGSSRISPRPATRLVAGYAGLLRADPAAALRRARQRARCRDCVHRRSARACRRVLRLVAARHALLHLRGGRASSRCQALRCSTGWSCSSLHPGIGPRGAQSGAKPRGRARSRACGRW